MKGFFDLGPSQGASQVFVSIKHFLDTWTKNMAEVCKKVTEIAQNISINSKASFTERGKFPYFHHTAGRGMNVGGKKAQWVSGTCDVELLADTMIGSRV